MDAIEPKVKGLGSADSGSGVIYVVDDEPMLLELASVILERLGYCIKTFRSPEAAFEEYRRMQPHPVLIITDYAMHTMNGLELIAACRQIQPAQKALLVSGTVGPEIIPSEPSRLDGYLAKPYEARQLIDAVRSMLAN